MIEFLRLNKPEVVSLKYKLGNINFTNGFLGKGWTLLQNILFCIKISFNSYKFYYLRMIENLLLNKAKTFIR